MHRNPEQRFFRRHGFYRAKCRRDPIPRFLCRGCGKSFSRQTFRADYRDHKPQLNAALFEVLASGLGLRQSSRILRLSLRCTQLKFRKIGRHLRGLNLNLRGPLPRGATLQFDEFETFEGKRNTRPLSIPVLIERSSRFLVWAECATIRPRGRMTPLRQAAMDRDERRFGPREDRSRRSVFRALVHGRRLADRLPIVVLETDEKSSYGTLARRVFADRLVHRRTSGRLARGTWNPLFPINSTEAIARDLNGRLRRKSWLASKAGRYLDLQLFIHMAWRNYVRERFCRDPKRSAAQVLGFVERMLRPEEVLGWRQDWRGRSIHPTAA